MPGRPILVFSTCLLLACGPDDPGSSPDAGPDPHGPEICDPAACDGAPPGTLVLGGGIEDVDSGTIQYVPLSPDQEVTVVQGFQGGQHMWVVLRAQGIQVCFVRPHYQIIADDGTVVLDGRFGGEFYPLPGEPRTFEFLTYAAFVSEPARVHRRPTTLRAEVSDGCGHLISDQREVIPVDSRLDEPAP